MTVSITNTVYKCFYVFVLHFIFYSLKYEWNSLDECNVYNLYKQISIQIHIELDKGNKNSLHCLKRREGLFSFRLILSVITEQRLLLLVIWNIIDMTTIKELVLWIIIPSSSLKVIIFLHCKIRESYLSRALGRVDGGVLGLRPLPGQAFSEPPTNND